MTAPVDPLDFRWPGASEEERQQRLRLYKARDIAGARAARSSEGWTYHVFRTAEELATDYIWRRATVEELRRVANAVGRMIQSATELEAGLGLGGGDA